MKQTACIRKISIVQDEVSVFEMGVFIEMVDAVCVEERAAPFDAMNLIALAKKKLRQVGPVLPGYAGD
jgi:hypothetical protein